MLCSDCGVDAHPHTDGGIKEDYMVYPDLWEEVGMPPAGTEPIGGYYLCVGCFESRLGRTLTTADFTHCPVNNVYWYPHSERLASRLEARS